MKTRLINFLETLSANFWMIPAFFLLSATALAFFNFYLDKTLFARHVEIPGMYLYFNNSQNIRSLLSVSAGSILGVAGVSFSITIASLTLASQQFGPRLLRNFMLDRFNQVVLGIFIGTFLYCLLMLQFTSSMDLEKTTPFVSMVGLLVLVVINLLALVFFIHHVAVSIQADTVINEVSSLLKEQLESLFPEPIAETDHLPKAAKPDNLSRQFKKEGIVVNSKNSGYLQAIDIDGLLNVVTEEDIALKISIKPGDFISRKSEIGKYLGDRVLEETISDKIQENLVFGSIKTAAQDPEFAIRQLVEVAVRALSPGINDPFTAIACIDQLGDNIAFLTRRQFQTDQHFDESGRLRLMLNPVTFNGIVEASFNQIRQHGKDDVAVTIHLMNMLLRLSKLVITSEQAKSIKLQAESLQASCENSFNAEKDQNDLAKLYENIKLELKNRFAL